jgi:hypothetical protein
MAAAMLPFVAGSTSCGRVTVHPSCPATLADVPPREVSGSPCIIESVARRRVALYAASELTKPLAYAEDLPVRWSELGLWDKGMRGRIELRDNHVVRFSGWGTTDGIDTHVTHTTSFGGGHLWIPEGEAVSVHASGTRVVFEPTGCILEGERFELEARCDILGSSGPRVEGTGHRETTSDRKSLTQDDCETAGDPRRGARVWPTGSAVDLLAAPSEASCAIHRLLNPWIPIFVIERREGFVHVVGGTTIAFDAWAPARELGSVEPELDRGSMDRSDSFDACPDFERARVVREAELRVGVTPHGRPFATAEVGTLVDVKSRSGEFVAVAFSVEEAAMTYADFVIPPKGEELWLPVDALELDDPDGCPDDTADHLLPAPPPRPR